MKAFTKVKGSEQTMGTASKYFVAPPWACAFSIQSSEDGTTASDFEWAFTEKIQKVRFYDDSAGTYTNYDDEAVDGDTSTVIVLDSMEGGADFLYIGCDRPFRGLHIDVGAANGTASVMTVKYNKTDGTWADISDTDNTASGGATFAQDGTITWTVPSDWDYSNVDGNGGPHFWVRIEVSVTLDSETEVDDIVALAEVADYNDETTEVGQGTRSPITYFDTERVGGIEAKAASGTPEVGVQWYGKR